MKLPLLAALTCIILQPFVARAQVPGACETPVQASMGKPGCYLDAERRLGNLPDDIYWHIDGFDSLEDAQRAATTASYAVVVFGKAYLQTVNADPLWRPTGGVRLATVGPLPLAGRGKAQTARFMESNTTASMAGRAHVHSGPEAWFVVDGAQCLETPTGVRRIAQGESGWIERGPSMALSNGGAPTRKALVLVVHPSDEPWMTMDPTWRPKGLCRVR
jgi:hypothetical protein